MFKNALVSVSDKTGLIEFVKPLVDKGMRVVSTGGTAKHLEAAGIEVVKVSEQTGFPEVLGGRVKTLHPKVHMALLARQGNTEDDKTLAEYDIQQIDLVIGNLYPFEAAAGEGKTGLELAEFIDIGGPSFLRAAAKNYERILTVCDPGDYEMILEKGNDISLETRKELAAKIFSHTSTYDAMISANLLESSDLETQQSAKKEQSFGGKLVQELRYGENPQQKAAWYRSSGNSGLHGAVVLQGKALSYNNLLDLDAAVNTLRRFPNDICCISVKHNNPCGVAIGSSVEEAVERSIKADPVSVFGGIIAVNREVTKEVAEVLSSLFFECLVAPSFSEGAKTLFAKKKNLRLLEWAEVASGAFAKVNFKSVLGGFLKQTADTPALEWGSDWKVFGEQPTEQIKQDILFCWKVCAHLKSNAIAISENQQTLGLGMGQVNRVDAVEQAIQRSEKFHKITGSSVVASDAFFPFPDSVEMLAEAGLKWVIQPGGSVKDEEVISAAQRLGVNMVFTGQRHFLH